MACLPEQYAAPGTQTCGVQAGLLPTSVEQTWGLPSSLAGQYQEISLKPSSAQTSMPPWALHFVSLGLQTWAWQAASLHALLLGQAAGTPQAVPVALHVATAFWDSAHTLSPGEQMIATQAPSRQVVPVAHASVLQAAPFGAQTLREPESMQVITPDSQTSGLHSVSVQWARPSQSRSFRHPTQLAAALSQTWPLGQSLLVMHGPPGSRHVFALQDWPLVQSVFTKHCTQ
jgi:hypothetical protein